MCVCVYGHAPVSKAVAVLCSFYFACRVADTTMLMIAALLQR